MIRVDDLDKEMVLKLRYNFSVTCRHFNSFLVEESWHKLLFWRMVWNLKCENLVSDPHLIGF